MTSNLSREELEKKLCELQSQIDSLNLIYRSVVDNSLDAILLTIPDGRILAANKAATKLFLNYKKADGTVFPARLLTYQKVS